LHGIVKQFYGNISIVKPSAKVITIEPAQYALTIEWAVELFSAGGPQFISPAKKCLCLMKKGSGYTYGESALSIQLAVSETDDGNSLKGAGNIIR
jgi:hypothetical protein